jgi:hypothetical protein
MPIGEKGAVASGPSRCWLAGNEREQELLKRRAAETAISS